MTQVVTGRMTIVPVSDEEMQTRINAEPDENMKAAYSEMLAGCKAFPAQRLWHTIWEMRLNTGNKPVAGELCFKGLNDGVVEVGYGTREGYEGQGLMTEALTALSQWAARQPGVLRVESETDAHNTASQRVLQKSGFVPNGIMGEEGPRYVLKVKKN